jgi:hypothetical protein
MNRPEQTLQKQIAAYLRYALPPEVWWTAVNPVPGKTPAVAGLSKAMGLRPGVPDLIFVHRGAFFAIELKAGKGTESVPQLECAAALQRAGCHSFLCRSLAEVQGVLDANGVILRARAA